jgi:tetratricopeptide (TPR) repeat protein
MLTHVKKISVILFVSLWGLKFLSAQQNDPSSAPAPGNQATSTSPAPRDSSSAPQGNPFGTSAPGAASAPSTSSSPASQPAAVAPAGGTAPSDSSSTALDYLFNHKPQDGSAAQGAGGVVGNIGDKMKAADILDMPPGLDDPVARQRFEIYLRHPEVSRARIQEYTAKMTQLSETLKQGNSAFAGWKMLYALGEYQDLDAGISRELANRVETVWNTARTNGGIDQKNTNLQRDINTSDRNADLIAEELRTEEQERRGRVGSENGQKVNPAAPPTADAAGGGGGESTAPANPDVAGSMQLTAEYLHGLEGRARIKLNEVQQDVNVKRAKDDFEGYITTLYGSHRYYQVIIAADFYRQVFNEGDYPVAMANQVNASLEVNNNVQLAVDDFKDEAAKGQIAGAVSMLQTAFAGNEFHPALQGVALDQKQKVSEYLRKLDVLKNVLESRDFGRVEGLVADITKIASDFDSTKAMAMINGVKLESTLRLGKAKMLAQQGDLKDAMDEFQGAAEAWPGNPDLHDSATLFFNSEDVKTQSTAEFDRLIQDQNYRAIFDKQLALAPAIHGNAQREEQLKMALEKVQKAEMASEKANVLILNGDVDGAWETIKEASKDWPQDNKLNKALADLSGRATEFVAAVNKAQDAEAKKNMGYSLTWYLNAQHIYPASMIANAGIDRLSKELLSSNPTASSVTN